MKQKDLILDSPMETESLQSLEKGGDQLSAPEQWVTDENETSGNTELEGEEDPSMHVGSEIAPIEFTEFDNNLVGVNKFPREGIGEKDVFSVTIFNGRNDWESIYDKKEK